jgi:beta-mannosidase
LIKKQLLNDNWLYSYNNQWKTAQIPGSIHQDLLFQNQISDPFFGDNEKGLEWIGKRDWVYKLSFTPDRKIFNEKNIFIYFEGLDTYADIIFNGQKILETNNMFHPWTFDIKEFLKPGENEIEVKFRSAINEILPTMKTLGYELPADNDQAGKTSPHTRKAPYHYGWDWGPSLVATGIWRDVYLLSYKDVHVENFMISNVSIDNNVAELMFELIITSTVDTSALIFISEEKSKTDKKVKFVLKKGQNHFKKSFFIADPELWWPAGHGDQPLYDFNVVIESNGSSVTQSKKIGIRDVFIKREKDDRGESFEIHVNKKPIFSKGANWIPADSFTTRLKKADYEKLIISAVEANMNTLRIWGGGIYEPDYFYELCDEYGILIWQDFMFACSMYPATENFLKSVEKEAEYQITRLKSFASIVLWCGNNEIASAWISWGWKEELPKSVWDDYEELFHKLLPALCSDLDPTRLYWPSSPGHDLDLPTEDQIYGKGDNHYWGVWHGGDSFEAFEKNVGRFMSEYGMQSFPSLKTINSFTEPKDRTIDSDVMNSHQKASLGTGNIMMYLEKYYIVPEKFNHVVELSQIMQAEAMKYAVETHRQNMPYCMGTLYWQFNDCWPGISWSSIDYRGDWKALHFAAKHFYSPILTMIKKNEKSIDVFLINDLDKSFTVQLNILVSSFDGLKLFKKSINGVVLNPASSDLKYSFDIPSEDLLLSQDLSEALFYSECVVDGKVLSKNELFFVRPKELKLREPDYEISHRKKGKDILVTIKAKTFMYRLFVQCENIDGRFSDNYFHLKADEAKEILFTPTKDLGSLNVNQIVFLITSLYDLKK